MRTCGRLVGGCAAAVRSLHAAVSPEPGDAVVGLSVDQINPRFAAACAASGLEGRRTSHGGRVGLAVELTARGASTHAIQLAGGWKYPAMIVRYAAAVVSRDGAVSRYNRGARARFWGSAPVAGERFAVPALGCGAGAWVPVLCWLRTSSAPRASRQRFGGRSGSWRAR